MPLSRLTPAQQEAVRQRVGTVQLVEDCSWGLIDTVVLHVRSDGRDLTVKAAGPDNHHMMREVTAHHGMTAPLVSIGRAPELVLAVRELNLLVTTWLPGELVQGSAAEADPDVYRQTGELLRRWHGPRRTDPAWATAYRDKALAWLDKPHRIAPATAVRLRERLAAAPTGPVELAPTHGDFHPRNWLLHEGQVSLIDFGRADPRPPMTDLARLAAKQWRGPGGATLEDAFLDGYGVDPRPADPGLWELVRLQEAVGTAAWAHQVGDEAFEAQGHRMIAEALAG